MDYLNITLGIALHSGNTLSSGGQGPTFAARKVIASV